MGVTPAVMVAKEDTELQDLLGPVLENSAILYCIKAHLRAAVPLALDEQKMVENKTPLVNKSLKSSSNTKDSYPVASLAAEFFSIFNCWQFSIPKVVHLKILKAERS